MILHSVRVHNFKCVNDSTIFKVDEKVTYLVGKNESGKTTLLQAISKLNPVAPATGEFTILEYPRSRMVAYQQRSDTHLTRS
jgi:predicted ATP-dependent endonuclease of OLD family